MHSKGDQTVPYDVAGPLSAKLLPKGIRKTYTGLPHGMITTQAETVDADVLESSGRRCRINRPSADLFGT